MREQMRDQMRELILSDITLMGRGYCVIGLERIGPDQFRSVRPMPPSGFAWIEPFPYKRGDCVRFSSRTGAAPAAPHVEDKPSCGLEATPLRVSEGQLVGFLKQAEVADDPERLFGCELRPSPRGGKALWAKPGEAQRSICGCELRNIWFQIYIQPDDITVRARLSFGGGARLESLPIVDRDWRQFVGRLIESRGGPAQVKEAEGILNHSVRRAILASAERFVRIGLPRPKQDGLCWLMLDSLFPQPRDVWLGPGRSAQAPGLNGAIHHGAQVG